MLRALALARNRTPPSLGDSALHSSPSATTIEGRRCQYVPHATVTSQGLQTLAPTRSRLETRQAHRISHQQPRRLPKLERPPRVVLHHARLPRQSEAFAIYADRSLQSSGDRGEGATLAACPRPKDSLPCR